MKYENVYMAKRRKMAKKKEIEASMTYNNEKNGGVEAKSAIWHENVRKRNSNHGEKRHQAYQAASAAA